MTAWVTLTTPLPECVGDKTAKALESLFDLTTVHDLLLHTPRRYTKRGELSSFSELREGEEVTVVADVANVDVRSMKTKAGKVVRDGIVTVTLTDGSRRLSASFFQQGWRARQLPVGTRAIFSGKVKIFRDQPQLSQPDCVLLDGTSQDGESIDAYAGAMIPIYRASNKLASWRIAMCVKMVLDVISWPLIPDPLPEELRLRYGLLDMAAAYYGIHRPEDLAEAERARERLRWEEALAIQTVLAVRRRQLRAEPATPRRQTSDQLLARLDARMPFQLTQGQERVSHEIFTDLACDYPMHRLLQGEVGSGKTIVALRAMLAVVDAGGQAALLAPTEVLAAQHLRTIKTLMGPLALAGTFGAATRATEVVLLTGSASTAVRREAMLKAASGQAGIVIGTHAILEDKVQFADLGLVVIDEQHRFGVEQRAALTAKARDQVRPHVLVMTATPIPRTVAMTVFGDLEVSTLKELPRGRADITTHVVPAARKPQFLNRAWERVREEVAAGRQAYVVCPSISDSAGLELDPIERPLASVDSLFDELTAGPLAGLRLEKLHGRLTGDEKDALMQRFSSDPSSPHGIDVLISTTVIEVGVDVPNASVMLVMDAERFGISQLHQLRGRIGRGEHPGLCLLVTYSPEDSAAYERLEQVSKTIDGFTLARLDLQVRREGDVLGADQSGRKTSLRQLSLLRDEAIITDARREAEDVVSADPTLKAHHSLRELARELVGPAAAAWLDRS